MKVFHTCIIATIVLAAGTGTVAAHAQRATPKPTLLWCQDCNGSQLRQTIMNQPLGSTVYVGNAIEYAVSAYTVTNGGSGIIYKPQNVGNQRIVQGAKPLYGRTHKIINSITPDPNIVSGIHKAMDFYNATPTGWHKTTSVRVDPTSYGSAVYPGSVYDVIDYGRKRNKFMDKFDTLYSPTFAAETVESVMQGLAAVHLLDNAALPTVTVTINFSDGSSVEIYMDSKSGKAIFDADTARDSDDNNVPYIGQDAKAHDFGGNHGFSPSPGGTQNHDNFVNWLFNNKISLNDGGFHHGAACTAVSDPDGTVEINCTQF